MPRYSSGRKRTSLRLNSDEFIIEAPKLMAGPRAQGRSSE